VWERLKKLGFKDCDTWTEEQLLLLRGYYYNQNSSINLDELAKKIGKLKSNICRKARELGLTNIKRKKSKELKARLSSSRKEWFRHNEHPRGMLGKKHNQTTLGKLSKSSKKNWAKMSDEKKDEFSKRCSDLARRNPQNGEKRSWKAGWREIGGQRKYFRSRWEANYGRYLEWLKQKGQIKKWAHEPKTFWFEGIKRGCLSYLPDFCITENNGDEVYHEVKGWMDDRSKTKIKRMAKYYPQIKLIIIQRKNYMEIRKKVSALIEGWE
jgi:hypothetical protein